jgi:hypothetical protein
MLGASSLKTRNCLKQEFDPSRPNHKHCPWHIIQQQKAITGKRKSETGKWLS